MDKGEDTPEMIQRQSETTYREGFQENQRDFFASKGLFLEQDRCPFPDYMNAVLYGPSGYYRNLQMVPGRSGDFYTSVSVGPLFGEILASEIAPLLESSEASEFWLIEQGAHHGQLMLDVCEALYRSLHESKQEVRWEKLRVGIVEPFPERRALQKERLTSGILSQKWDQGFITWFDSEQDLPKAEGLFWANELLDAFAPHVAEFDTQEGWNECWVHLQSDGTLGWERGPWVGEGWENEVSRWEEIRKNHAIESGHRVEWCPKLTQWVQGVVDSGWRGGVLLFDYGISREDRFESGRRHGTLRRYRNHQMDDRVFDQPGESDLTWQVDWPAVREAFQVAGWEELGFLDQSRYLIHAGSNLLRSREGKVDLQWSRQFQTLTHPGMMGGSFQVLGVASPSFRGTLSGFSGGKTFL